MPDKPTTPKPRKPQPMRLGKAIPLTLTDAQEKAVRDAHKETGIPQAEILEMMRAAIEPQAYELVASVRDLDSRQIALQKKKDELAALVAKLEGGK